MAEVQSPDDILRVALQRAEEAGDRSLVQDAEIRHRIESIALSTQNRALVRLLLSCSLAAAHNPSVDIRKPYTEIGTPDSFSGRSYDESHITHFVQVYRLPCNPTTAFLTPALRNRNVALTPDVDLVGRPPQLYRAAQQLLDDVYQRRLSAEDLLAETIRWLLIMRDEKEHRLALLIRSLNSSQGQSLLSAEAIVTLIEQHLRLPRSSRLPVLIVAAAYNAAREQLGEAARPLLSHNAADRQTGSLGDVEITLISSDQVITSYEMKTRVVSIEDIDLALEKIAQSKQPVDNYIFITTERIDPAVQAHAHSLYESTGVEFVILDCIGFLRHFLHLFHRLRHRFVEEYQALLLAEPESAVSQPLKEAFLTMRLAAESID
ncbi:MAG TPA: hypothetical protein VNK95_11985 [Caldilineaceae bacterium]|nr:hypothetical protein [Caldilineaceae bacterium]